MNTIDRRAEHTSELMKGAGYAIGVLANLVLEDGVRKTYEGDTDFLNGYSLGGIVESIRLIGRMLSAEGEELEELVETRKTLAERQLRKGSDSGKENLGQCGRGMNA